MTHFSGEKKRGGVIRGFLCLLLSVSQGKPDWQAKEGREGGAEEVGRNWGWAVRHGGWALVRGLWGGHLQYAAHICDLVRAPYQGERMDGVFAHT